MENEIEIPQKVAQILSNLSTLTGLEEEKIIETALEQFQAQVNHPLSENREEKAFNPKSN